MAYPDGAPPSAPAAPRAARCDTFIPTDVFRERLLRLANEYELMQASFASLLGEGGGALPRRDEENTPVAPFSLRGVRVELPPGMGADEASFASLSEADGDVTPRWDDETPPVEGKPKTPRALFCVPAQLSKAEADKSTSDDRLREPALSRSPDLPDLEISVGPKRSEQVIDTVDFTGSPSSLTSPGGNASRRPVKTKSVIRVETPQHDWKTSPLAWLAASTNFERFIAGIIVLNVVFLGVSTEKAMSDAWGGDAGKRHVSFQAIEAGFLVIYILELVIRIVGVGTAYFTDANDRFWNFFDMALVLQSLIEQVGEVANVAGGAGNLTFLRGLRLVKTLKMLRVVRLLRSMRELRMLLFAVLNSLKSMAWSLLLLGAVLYMFALMLLQGMISYVEALGGSVNDGVSEDIVGYWGDVHTGMLTLFMSSSGGIDWEGAFDALSHAGLFFQLLFLTYLTFFIFVVTNAITSVFVEATFEHAARDLIGRVQTNLAKKQEYAKHLHMLFEEMDDSNDGQLSLEEFEKWVEDPKMNGFLSSLDLTIRDPTSFYSVLSDDGRKVVDTEQFVTSCVRMVGPAQAADVHAVLTRQCKTHEMICDLKRSLDAQLGAPS